MSWGCRRRSYSWCLHNDEKCVNMLRALGSEGLRDFSKINFWHVTCELISIFHRLGDIKILYRWRGFTAIVFNNDQKLIYDILYETEYTAISGRYVLNRPVTSYAIVVGNPNFTNGKKICAYVWNVSTGQKLRTWRRHCLDCLLPLDAGILLVWTLRLACQNIYKTARALWSMLVIRARSRTERILRTRLIVRV